MSASHHRVPVVLTLGLTATIACGAASAATRHAPAPQQTPGVLSAATATVIPAVAVTRPHAQARPRAALAHARTPVRHARPSRRRIATKPTQALVRHRPARHRAAPPSGPTGWAALDAAIARIPTYPSGRAMWVVSNKYGFWGTADWYHDTLYVAPGVPERYLYAVAVHEWSHELSVLDYAGDVDAAVKAMNAVFGGSGLTGAERAADCMAILQGATWTHYTTCSDTTWRRAAAKLVAGQRL